MRLNSEQREQSKNIFNFMSNYRSNYLNILIEIFFNITIIIVKDKIANLI